MTDEELREKIAEGIWAGVFPNRTASFRQLRAEDKKRISETADQILSLIKRAGYKKVPELKVLDKKEQEEFAEVSPYLVVVENIFPRRCVSLVTNVEGLLKAQCDYDLKQIEEANNGSQR